VSRAEAAGNFGEKVIDVARTSPKLSKRRRVCERWI
jgi:hypothetical protein